jgi:cytochrome c
MGAALPKSFTLPPSCFNNILLSLTTTRIFAFINKQTMKKYLLVLSAAAALVACGGNADTPAAASTEKPADISTNPDYQKGLALVAKSDCLTCHKVNEASTGPSYKDIATKYASADASIIDTLAGKIIKGGSGNWGQIPMTAHPTLSEEDAKAMVKYVLLLK